MIYNIETMNQKQSFNIEIAEVTFKVYPYTDKLFSECREYITDRSEQEVIEIKENDIQYEQDLFLKEYHYESKDIAAIEKAALLRKICRILANQYQSFLFHSVALLYEGKAYLFTAKSGTGKTTHTQKWISLIENTTILNNDKPFIKVKDDAVYVFGSPWTGKEKIGENTSAPLGGIICLEQSKSNEIKTMSDQEKWDFLFGQLYRSEESTALINMMDFLKHLIHEYRIVKLCCNMEDEAVETIYKEIKSWK